MSSAGMAEIVAARLSPCSIADGLPSIRICTLVDPRRLTVPSGSTFTDGTLERASATESLLVAASCLMS